MKNKLFAVSFIMLVFLSIMSMVSVVQASEIVGFSDNFNDNVLNTSLWEITRYPNNDNVLVRERNQRIEVKINYQVTEGWGGGLVTKKSYDLTADFDLSVDCHYNTLSGFKHMHLIIATEKRNDITEGWDLLDYYFDYDHVNEWGELHVWYRNGGAENDIIEKTASTCFGLRIVGYLDKLKFYYKSTQTGSWLSAGTWYKTTDLFDMSSMYIYFTAVTTTGSGIAIFDNFSLTISSVQLIKDSDLETSFCSGNWEKGLPDWNDHDPPDTDAIISSGYFTGWVLDTDNGDYSDATGFQGKKPHATGYYCSDNSHLGQEIIVPKDVADGKLIANVLLRVPNYPEAQSGIINPIIAYSKNCGLLIMVYFECYVHDKYGDEYWLDFSSPYIYDFKPDMAVIEMFNRWSYDNDQWVQVSSADSRFNFWTDMTTHDTDLHSIRAGWTVTVGADPVYKTVDIGKLWRELCEWTYYKYGVEGYLWYIVKGRVKTVAVSVEGYMAKFKGEIYQIQLMWYN